jgi:hypothetical protein
MMTRSWRFNLGSSLATKLRNVQAALFSQASLAATQQLHSGANGLKHPKHNGARAHIGGLIG